MTKRIAGPPPQTQPITNGITRTTTDPLVGPLARSSAAPAAVLDPTDSTNQIAQIGQMSSIGRVDHTDSIHQSDRIGVPADRKPSAARAARKSRTSAATGATRRFAAEYSDEHATNRQAELFYLQKQIQTQTQMVFILEDGSQIQGVIEWYDRNSIKVRGRSRVLIYKSAIKYLYKAGEVGSGPDS